MLSLSPVKYPRPLPSHTFIIVTPAPTIAERTCAGVNAGFSDLTTAACLPDTCGATILVPLSTANPWFFEVEFIFTPGAP